MEKHELKALRKARKMTLNAFADLVGYSPNYLSRLENEPGLEIKPRCARVIRMALALLPDDKPAKKTR